MAKNYFGDGSDGNVVIAANTQLVVPNKNGSYDGDMVVKNYGNLTINEGFTLTTDQACRGMLIYVAGDCTINGALSMTARGPYANPNNPGGSDLGTVPAGGLQYPVLMDGESDTLSSAVLSGCGNGAVAAVANQGAISGNGKIITFVKQGAAGGTGGSGSGGTYYPGHTARTPGANGSTGQTGGGGGGAAQSGAAGDGSYGSCWGGGSGSGGAVSASWPTNATPWGGPGSAGTHQGSSVGGGAGNPGGPGFNGGGAGLTGTGGLLMLIVGGNLIVGSNGSVQANGVDGGYGGLAGGGASGGGNIAIMHVGDLTNNGTIEAAGGTGGYCTDYGCSGLYGCCGGDGGLGSIQQYQITAGYGLSGTTSETVRVFVLNEANWSVVHNDVYPAGRFVIPAAEGKKSVFARRNSGEVVGYGSIDPT